MSYQSGRYWGRITGNELGETNNGNPQIVIRFLIEGRMNVEDPSGALIPCEHGERTIFRVITDKTVDWVIRDLASLGYTKPGWHFLDPSDANYVSLAGTQFEAECKLEPYDGQLKEKWGIYNPGSAPQVKPLDKSAVRKLDSLFGKKLKDGLADAKSVSDPREYSAPVDEKAEQDIPF